MKAKISSISQSDEISLFGFNNDTLFMLGLGLNGLKVGDDVVLGFKSSDVIIATSVLSDCSLNNVLKSIIIGVEVGKIVSVVELKYKNFNFQSIITTKSFNRLNLKVGDEIYAYIKATSLHISEILC